MVVLAAPPVEVDTGEPDEDEKNGGGDPDGEELAIVEGHVERRRNGGEMEGKSVLPICPVRWR